MTATTGCDTADMRLVHRVFRREFALLPAMVRAVRPGDTARSALVAAHAREQIDALEHHHHGEDELLWPPLAARAAFDGDVLDRMRAQHHEVATLLARATGLLTGWTQTAGADDREQLADVLADASSVLAAHLGEEEQHILPAVEQHITSAEWAEVGKRGMASIPPKRRLVFLAHIMEDATPEEQTTFLTTHVPPPVRLAYRILGRRQHRRETTSLRASAG